MSRSDLTQARSELFDPYRTPTTQIGSIHEASPIQFSVGEVMARSWAIYQSRMGLCIAIAALAIVASIAAEFVFGMFIMLVSAVTKDPIAVGVVVGLVFLGLMIFTVWVGIGQSVAYLKLAQGRWASVEHLFTGGPFLLKVFVGSLVLGLISGALLLSSMIPGSIASFVMGPDPLIPSLIMILGWVGSFLILSVYWVYVSQFIYVMIDHPELGAIESIRRSMEITKGHWWGISLLFFIAGSVNVLGVLALGIGSGPARTYR